MEKIAEKKQYKKSIFKSQKNVLDGDMLLKTLSKYMDVNKTLYDVLKENGDIVEDENGNIIKNNFV
jgi:hypothetical protein